MKIKLLFLLCICFAFQGCPMEEQSYSPAGHIILRNLATETVYFKILFSNIPQGNSLLSEGIAPLEPGGEIRFPFGENDFRNGRKVYFDLYKQSTVDQHTLDAAIEQGLYDKRYMLTKDELIAMQWVIVYDGN